MQEAQELAAQATKLAAKLATEQKQWQAQRNSRLRELNELDAVISARKDQRDELVVTVAELKTDKDALVNNIDTLSAESLRLNTSIAKLNDRKASLIAEDEQYEAELSRKKANIDKTLAEYKKAKQEEINAELKDLIERQEALKLENDELGQAAQSSRERLSGIEDAVQSAQSSADERREHAEESKRVAETALAVLTNEIQILESKKRALASDVVSMRQELAKATAAHEHFKDYESSAKKVLDARESALLERQVNIENDEQMIQNRRKFLPRM